MSPFMTLDAARAKARPAIIVGQTYTFYSDCVSCESVRKVLIRSYSGQPVTVIKTLKQDEPGTEALYTVRAANDDEFTANNGELNGWIFDTGQWVGPRIA
jgi:hypothetical protein